MAAHVTANEHYFSVVETQSSSLAIKTSCLTSVSPPGKNTSSAVLNSSASDDMFPSFNETEGKLPEVPIGFSVTTRVERPGMIFGGGQSHLAALSSWNRGGTDACSRSSSGSSSSSRDLGASQIAEQLQFMGRGCKPFCSQATLDERCKKRSLKRIEADLRILAKPKFLCHHPPCFISGAMHSKIEDQYNRRYAENLKQLYQNQLEREMNIEQHTPQKTTHARAKTRGTSSIYTGRLKGKFSNDLS
eukprot:Lankesteria_metandrocarpae@DN2096_c0_g1_i1.p1